jgi:hypothetical protein
VIPQKVHLIVPMRSNVTWLESQAGVITLRPGDIESVFMPVARSYRVCVTHNRNTLAVISDATNHLTIAVRCEEARGDDEKAREHIAAWNEYLFDVRYNSEAAVTTRHRPRLWDVHHNRWLSIKSEELHYDGTTFTWHYAVAQDGMTTTLTSPGMNIEWLTRALAGDVEFIKDNNQ